MRIAIRSYSRMALGALLSAIVLLALAQVATAQDAFPKLAGTSWQLIRFHGHGDEILMPQDNANYTVTFGADGHVSAQIDCNRGMGTWSTSAPDGLKFGPLALTRAQCPPASLTDRLTGDWQEVRSYSMKDGHLLLSLGAEIGTFEFAPAGSESGASAPPPLPVDSSVTSVGPVTYACTEPGGRGGTLVATFYQTMPGLVLVVRHKQTRPAFQVLSADGSKYEGKDLSFWDARGEAMVTWSGRMMECKPQH